MLKYIENSLQDKFPQAKDLKFRHFLVQGYSNILIFVFCKGRKQPLAIAKVDRQGCGKLENESMVLQTLKGQEFKYFDFASVLEYRKDQPEVLLLSFSPGQRLSGFKPLYKNKSRQAVFSLVAEALIELSSFQRKTTVFDDKMCLECLNDVRQALGRSGESFNENLQKEFQRAIGEVFPVTLQHNDLWPGNIIYNNDRLLFVDWDKAVFKGLPGPDLFDFFLNFTRLISSKPSEKYLVHNERTSLYLQKAFFKTGLGDETARIITRFSQKLKLSGSLMRVFFLWHFLKKYRDSRILEVFYTAKERLPDWIK